VKKDDIEVLDYLKRDHPELYRKLRKAAKGRKKNGADTRH
jgi:hypothetical protein